MDIGMLDLTKELVKFRSTSYDELGVTMYLSNLLSKRKIPHVLDKFNPQDYRHDAESILTANLYVEVGEGSDLLVLYAHTDVVEAKGDMFMPEVKDNRLFGRGTADMKTAVAGMVHVLQEDYPSLNRKLTAADKKLLFVFIADEETSGTGIRRFRDWCDRNDLKGFKCILMEPTEDFTAIETGGKGLNFLQLKGKMRHMIRAFRTILASKQDLLARYPDKGDGFKTATIELTRIITDNIGNPDLKTIEGKACHASRPHLGINAIEKALKSETDITFIVTPKNGEHNSLPARAYILEDKPDHLDMDCVASIDIRTNLAASEGDVLLDAVKALIPPCIEVDVPETGSAFTTESDGLLGLCLNSIDSEVTQRIATGGSDAPHLLTLTRNMIPGFGPGKNSVVHSDEEYIDLEIIEKTPKVIRKLISNFIGQ
jgi:acetylornithine deacetylase/succinyl-diaminopimelate desuccinylase-like protein